VASPLVVIVDDSITNLKILERLAGSLGGGTIARTFADWDDALGFCSHDGPELVVLAAASGQGDAAQFIARLRELPEDRQQAAAAWLLDFLEHDQEEIELTPEQIAEIERRLEEDDVATDAEVKAFFDRIGR